MNFSRHQKQHLRQLMRNLANLFSAAGRRERCRGEETPLGLVGAPTSLLHTLASVQDS